MIAGTVCLSPKTSLETRPTIPWYRLKLESLVATLFWNSSRTGSKTEPVEVGNFMNLNVMLWSKYLLEGMFFTGLIGCVSVVIISWVSILKSAFSDSSED